MFTKLQLLFYRIREEIEEKKFTNFIHTLVFTNRIATPVEMDLELLPSNTPIQKDSEYKFIELTLNDLSTMTWRHTIESRRLKAIQNLKKGWRCFAVTKDTDVIGDVWCIPFIQGMANNMHPDLKMLGIRCQPREVYALDMLIDPAYRGKNLAVPLHRYLQLTLKNEGYHKVYGYYWNDNLPAMWMHRMIKFHELPKRQVSRFFSYIQSRPIEQSDTTIERLQQGNQTKNTKDQS